MVASPPMREVLPPMDNLARALLMRGAREPAMMLLKAAIRRGGDERARCESLLMAVQARPTDRVSGPPITLDAGLVESVAGSGRLYEAHAIALGADISRNVAGVEIAAALTEVFLPVDDWAPGWRVRWLDALASGGTVSLFVWASGSICRSSTGAGGVSAGAVSYTHLTLPTSDLV